MALMSMKKFLGMAGIGLVFAAAACGGESVVVPTVEPSPVQVSAKADMSTDEATPIPTPTARPTATPVPDATPEPTPTPMGYDSNRAMYDVFPGFTIAMARTYQALEDIEENDDTSMIPVLVEIIRFMPSSESRNRIADTLQSLTGQPFAGDEWGEWMDWMGENLDEVELPDKYADWKAALYSVIDERFTYFLRPARDFSRINLAEVVWGGVRPDGIPDLRRPTFLDADEADYMNPDDRVFGLEINGDVRAYPLRVVNAHEMVNDSVGGEPVSLMW